MTKRRNNIVFLIVALLVAGVGAYFVSPETQEALAGMFPGSVACNTSTATSTLSFMSPGVGTTTLSCATGKVDLLSVSAILAASSTGTRYRYRIERSLNNVDWYADTNAPIVITPGQSTTTQVTSNFAEYGLAFASTTNGTRGGTSQDIGFSGLGTTTGNMINFVVPTLRMDYTRVVFYIDPNSFSGLATSTNGAIRAEGVVKESVTR